MKSFPLCVLSLSLLLLQISAQQISDVWLITWDRKSLFTSIGTGKFPVNFTDPGSAGDADIVADDGTVYQSILGFGRSLSESHIKSLCEADSSAITLSNLQSANSDRYWTLLKTLFDTTDGANAAGLIIFESPSVPQISLQKVPYSLDDTPGDTSFNRFSVDRTPSQVPAVLKDILSINPQIKIHILPWSPPAWMKDSVTMDGGSLEANLTTAYSAYLLNAVKSYFKEGFTVYAVSIQNEPENNDKTYPSATMTAVVQARIGKSLRTLLDQNNFNNVKIIGNEHNWSDAAGFPISLIQSAPDAFDGVAFHCYQGAVADQDEFSSKFPSKEIYMTECSGTIGSDWWGDIKWYMDNLWIGALEHGAMAALMWNLALDDKGQPMLPESDSCDGGCRGIVTVSGGDYTLDQEFYSMAQASKAILPVNAGGPFGRRIDVAVKGASNSALRVGAYATGGVKGTDRTRYALVVMNWNDNSSQGSFNPTPVKATIEFRGKQAKYTFPVGVTTLWWFAPSN